MPAFVRAKQLGMRVTLNPFVELSNGQWRANFAPLPGSTLANTFWPQYESYLDEVATIAQNRGVDAMNVGTEMKGLDSFYTITDFDPGPGFQGSPSQAQLDQQKAYWDTVIDSVNSIYSGQIGYAANWDNFNSGRVTNNIWSHEHISYIGIDSYFRFESNPYLIPTSESDPLQTYPNEGFIQLVANEWSQRLDGQIMPFAAGQGKPVVFTEQGYQHHNGTSRNPQNESGSVDTAEQIMAFQGLLRAMDGRQDDLLAMHIWQWEMTGSQGSTWNINPSASANQPDNRPLAQWLSGFVQQSFARRLQSRRRRGCRRLCRLAEDPGPDGHVLRRRRRRRQRHDRRRRLQRLAGKLRCDGRQRRGPCRNRARTSRWLALIQRHVPSWRYYFGAVECGFRV